MALIIVFSSPNLIKNKLSSMVYNHFVSNASDCEPWNSWKKLWSLRVAPRAKHFLWLLFWGKIKTSDFLHALNLDPQDICVFSRLTYETAEHLMNLCPKSQALCNSVSSLVGKTISFPDGFTSRIWIASGYICNSNFVKSVIAATAWYISKTGCNFLFRNEVLDFNNILRKAFALAQEYFVASNS